jgi:hypothetical protein
MATAYTSLLGLALPVTGELSGAWGDVVNDSITSLLDSAISGTTSLTTDADVTLTTTTGAANEARQAIILWNPASGTVTRNVTAPAQSKIYTVINASGGTQSIVFRGAGPTTGVTVVKGESAVVAWNGTDFIKIGNIGGGGVFTTLSVSGDLTLSGGTANGVAYLNGSKVLTTGSALTFDGAKLNNTSGSGAGIIQSTDSFGSGNFVRILADSTFGSLINFTTGSSLRFATSADNFGSFAEQMRLTSTGLGIGTSSPTAKLDVNGITQSRGNIYGGTGNANANILAYSNVANGGAGSSQFLFANTSSETRGYLSYNHANDNLLIGTTGTTKATLDAPGNLGLGVTPSAWTGNVRALQIGLSGIFAGHTSVNLGYFGVNWYFDGTSNRYVNSTFANRFNANGTNGNFEWQLAPSGTAGNAISFTQAMTLTAAGSLGVGTTSPAQSWTGDSARVAQLQGGSAQITVLRINESSATSGDLQLVSSTSSEVGIYNFANGAMRFGTNGAERARIDSSGNLLVRTTSEINSYTAIQVVGTGGTNDCYAVKNTNTTNLAAFSCWNSSGSYVGGIVAGNTSTSFPTSSDYRLKENIAPLTGALAKVVALKPCTYTWKIDGSGGEGFIAHELQEVCPDAVVGEKDAVNEDGSIKAQGIDTSFLVATLTAAIQELKAEFDAYKASHP